MELSQSVLKQKPEGMSAEEWACRLELAACYRAFSFLNWIEMIYNHITVRVPGSDHHYLINPYGLNYNEVTATNLIKISLGGEIIGDSKYPVNRAGFVIHSAIHGARHDAQCVIHTHTTAGSAVSCKKDGLRNDNFYGAVLNGDVAYHEFGGVTTNTDEQPRLIKSLGNKSILILRNHGLLVVGPHVPQAFFTYYFLQRACEIQLATDAMRGDNVPVSPEVLEAIPAQMEFFRAEPRPGTLVFQSLLRRAGIRYEDLV